MKDLIPFAVSAGLIGVCYAIANWLFWRRFRSYAMWLAKEMAEQLRNPPPRRP